MLELKLDRLKKQYGQKIAVDQVSYTFSKGVYGLLGANGAGKTTLLRMICGILQPTAGEVLVDGSGIMQMGGEYKRLLGYLPQEFGFYPEFTAQRYMLYLASLKALPVDLARQKTEELLELVGLRGEEKHKIKTFSGGMLRRLGIAQAMLNDPEILIMDEPTSGLDPKERIRFRNIISALAKNRIVILSTHIVSDVEFSADRILMMKGGVLIRSGELPVVVEPVRGKVWEIEVPEEEVQRYNDRFAVSNLRNTEKGARLRVVSGDKPMENAAPVEPNLEDAYLYYFDELRQCGSGRQ